MRHIHKHVYAERNLQKKEERIKTNQVIDKDREKEYTNKEIESDSYFGQNQEHQKNIFCAF